MSENEKLREALAYEQGCRDTWDAVRGTNADMRPGASAAYITCVQAAKTTLEKAILARAALSTPCVEQDAGEVDRHIETLKYLSGQYLPGGPKDIKGAIRVAITALSAIQSRDAGLREVVDEPRSIQHPPYDHPGDVA